MKVFRRKTREQLRHERAVVLQELSQPTAAAQQQDWEANKKRAAELRQQARKRRTEA